MGSLWIVALERSIIESDEAWQELEYVADRLGNLSPLLSNENTEFELAQTSSGEEFNSQVNIAVNRQSLVSNSVSFFDNMSTTGTVTVTTTSTTTTCSSVTPVATTQSVYAPIASIGAHSRPNPYGLNLFQPHQATSGLRPNDVEATMARLEFEVEFSLTELRDDVPVVIADLRDEAHDEYTRKLKKATTLLDMRKEEHKRDNYEYILTYTCATIDQERRSETKRKIRELSSLINTLKVAASDEGIPGAQAVQQPAQVQMQPVYQMKAAKIKPIDLPHFSGEIARYKTFKVNFNGLVRCTDIPEHLWGPYLFEALDEDTKLYAGLSESWQGRYEELWEHLDSRFANRWTVAAETLKATIMSTPPEENNWETMVY